MNDPDSFLDRRADADDAPDGAGPRGPLDAESRALTPEETANIAAMSTGRTHWDRCWQDLSHSDCARARVACLEAELDQTRAARDEALRQGAAATERLATERREAKEIEAWYMEELRKRERERDEARDLACCLLSMYSFGRREGEL
jgi:hypothetical protein